MLSLPSIFVRLVLWSSLASAAPSLPLGRDWALTLRGDLRPRVEVWRDGVRDPSAPSWDAAVTQRSRLGTEFSHREGLQLEMALQDVRAWGGSLPNSGQPLEIYTANLLLPLDDRTQVVVGRQELDVGHPRLLGNEDFWQRGRSFDGALLTLDAPPQRASLFYAKLREGSAGQFPERRDVLQGDHDIGGAVSRTTLVTNHDASVLFLVDRDSHLESTRYTLGGLFAGARGPLRYSAEVYGQSGIERDEPVAAYFMGLNAEFLAPRRFSPRLALWLEHASGDGTREGSFSAPLGSHHEYFGALDLFVDLPNDTAFGGLTDFGAAAGARPQPWLALNLDWHCFASRTAEGVRSFVGQELDFSALFELGDVVTLEALAAVLLPNGTLAALRVEETSADPSYELAAFVSLRARF